MRSRPGTTTTRTLLAFLVSGVLAVAPGAAQQSESSAKLTEDQFAALVTEMQREVEALRGWEYKHPVKASLYTLEELRVFALGDSSEAGDGWGESARSDASMRMIGLIAPDCEPAKTFGEAMITFAPGLYDHRTKTLGIVKREAADYGSLFVRVIIAHELTHALDDQYFDLGKLMREHATSDAGFALGAVVEGSAVTLQERYERKAKRSGKHDSARLEEAQRNQRSGMRAILEAPPFVRTSFIARFPNGVRFLQRGDMTALIGPEGPECAGEAVRTALTNLPRSSEQILHPEKYWQGEQRDEPVIVSDQDVEKLLVGDELHIVHRDTFGELLCAVLTSPEDEEFNPMAMMTPGAWTSEAATGWGGDRFFLLATQPLEENVKQKPEILRGLWLTMWDTPDDRDEFVEDYAMHRALPSRSFFKLGKLGAVFLFGFDDNKPRALEERLQTKPPGFTRDQKPWSLHGAATVYHRLRSSRRD